MKEIFHISLFYKLFSPNENKEVISRDVQFDERKWWNWLEVSDNLMHNDENSSNIKLYCKKIRKIKLYKDKR